MTRLACALLVGALTTGCTSESPTPIDPRAMLGELVANVMLPALMELEGKAGDLEASAQSLQAEPSAASLAAAQDSWRAARASWRRTDAFGFGPAVDLKLAGAIDWWPANPDAIEEYLAGTDPIDATAVAALGTSSKGFMALEYMLFDSTEGDDAVLERLADETTGERRRLLVHALATNLRTDVATLALAWAPAGGDFGGEVARAGDSSDAYPTSKAAVDEVVNQIVVQAESVYSARIGKPFGKTSGGQVLPEAEESPRSDNSLADIQDTLHGIEAIYEGRLVADGLGLTDIVRSRNADADDSARAALALALGDVVAIPPPLRTALQEHPQEVERAWQSTRAFKRVLVTDVVGVLGVTLAFNANDGD